MQDGIDPTEVKVGDVVRRVWDDLVPGEDPCESCHCAYRVEVGDHNGHGKRRTVRVIAHDLRAGDVVTGVHTRTDGRGCHCDRYFTVNRLMTGAPFAIGTRVRHSGQQWHRDEMGGTATVYGSEGPYSDGSFEYDVMAAEYFSRATGADNPEIRPVRWSSLATRKVEVQ